MSHWWINLYFSLICPNNSTDLSQHWFRQWLVAWRHQAISWTNVELRLSSSFPMQLHRKCRRYYGQNYHLKLFLQNFMHLPKDNEIKFLFLSLFIHSYEANQHWGIYLKVWSSHEHFTTESVIIRLNSDNNILAPSNKLCRSTTEECNQFGKKSE